MVPSPACGRYVRNVAHDSVFGVVTIRMKPVIGNLIHARDGLPAIFSEMHVLLAVSILTRADRAVWWRTR